MRFAAMAVGLAAMLDMSGAWAAACVGHGSEVQVLGSGGPELEDKRASSSYLLWLEGAPLALVDAGGGSALKFGQSGARVEQLDAILFTHLHVDHSGDFPALIKSSYFESRNRPLSVYGPVGNQAFPSMSEFVEDLFGPKRGAFRYLSDFLQGGEGGYLLKAFDVALGEHEIKTILLTSAFSAAATPVIHGRVPALAWRLTAGKRTFVFSGDTNGDNGNLEKLARDADVFIAHNAVPEGTSGVLRQLHMPPSVIGRIAHAANVRKLVLSHRMLRTLGEEKQTLALINRAYGGPVSFADDGDCY
jgi:ribonuclease BN (tRNA processing enzyme)